MSSINLPISSPRTVAAFALRMPRPRRAGGDRCVLTRPPVLCAALRGATGRSATSSTSSVGQLAAALPVPLRLWRYGSQRDPLWCSSCDGVNIITLRHHHRGNRPSIRSPTSLPTREAKKLAENNLDTLRPKSDDCPKFSGILSDIPRNPQRWSGRSTSEILPCRCHELCRRIWELSRFTLATTGVVARRWIVNQQKIGRAHV